MMVYNLIKDVPRANLLLIIKNKSIMNEDKLFKATLFIGVLITIAMMISVAVKQIIETEF